MTSVHSVLTLLLLVAHCSCVTELDGTKSLWWLATRATEVVASQLAHEHVYTAARIADTPAPVHRSGFSRTKIREGLSHLKRYCAVTLVDSNELVTTEEDDTRFTVLYHDAFYPLSSAEAVAAFCADPAKYSAVTLPTKLPARRSAADVKAGFPKPVMWSGFCPVTYEQGGRTFDAIKAGIQDAAVE